MFRLLGCFYSWFLLCRRIRLDEKSCNFITVSTKNQFEGKVFIPFFVPICSVALGKLLGNETFFKIYFRVLSNQTKNDDFISKTGQVIMKPLRSSLKEIMMGKIENYCQFWNRKTNNYRMRHINILLLKFAEFFSIYKCLLRVNIREIHSLVKEMATCIFVL